MNRTDRISVVLAACGALIAGGAIMLYLTYGLPFYAQSADNLAVASAASTTQTTALPVRLLIPHIDVNAPIEHVGVTKTGLMASPGNFVDVGWYKYGTIPGNRGSAVIDGHLDNALALKGVFKRLDELKIGQNVQVKTDAGTTLTFRVIDMKVYPYDATPSSIFTSSDNAYLNLITCAGEWLQKAKTYDHRLVVYTELVQA